MLESLLEYDIQLLQFFNALGSSATDNFWLFITKIYVWIPLFIVLYYLSSKKYTKQELNIIFGFGLLLLACLLGGTELIKLLFGRLRPSNDPSLDGFFREVIHPRGYSFYSGHASTSMALSFYFITLLRQKLKFVYVLILWAVLFMFSRLYFAVHYPSDIIMGMLVGAIIANIFIGVVKKKSSKLIEL